MQRRSDRTWRSDFLQVLSVLCLSGALHAAETAAPEPTLREADAALRRGDVKEAIKVATQVLAAQPKNFQALFLRAKAYESSHDYAKSLADYTAGLVINPQIAFGYQNRGAVYFRLGRFSESVTDFDKLIELLPDQAPYLWQRGISLYYAGKYDEGRKQFELHQTVNPYDVENAMWHFLCLAKVSSVTKARAALIPIERDARVPMMPLHSLYAGKAKPEEILAAARAGSPSPQELDERLFYAHLYLGLFYDATGETKLAEENIFKAASDFHADHYMGDVARMHAQRLRSKKK